MEKTSRLSDQCSFSANDGAIVILELMTPLHLRTSTPPACGILSSILISMNCQLTHKGAVDEWFKDNLAITAVVMRWMTERIGNWLQQELA